MVEAYGVGERFLESLRCLLLDLVGNLGVAAGVGFALSLVVLHDDVWVGDGENGGGRSGCCWRMDLMMEMLMQAVKRTPLTLMYRRDSKATWLSASPHHPRTAALVSIGA